ncbi:MAG: NAD(P)-dependent oxidoreductase [Clostridia bacterium]|nr:NAD(P)-dependent oxidoreductase [Clostridia bacterium]
MKRPTILITGANGCAGYHIIKRLVESYHILAVDRKFHNLNEFNTNISLIEADVCKKEELDPLFSGVDYVIHLAAKVHMLPKSREDTEEFYKINTKASEEIFQLCLKHKVKKVIFFSTIAVYGSTSAVIDEQTPANPVTPYAKSKYHAELTGLKMVREKGLPLVILRPATIYGKLDRGNYRSLISLALKGLGVIPGRGDNIKPVIYAKDVAAACEKVLQSNTENGEVLIISEGNYKYWDILKSIEKAFDKKLFIIRIPKPIINTLCRYGKINLGKKLKTLTESIRLNNNKMVEKLGFKPEYKLLDGLRDSAEYYRKKK